MTDSRRPSSASTSASSNSPKRTRSNCSGKAGATKGKADRGRESPAKPADPTTSRVRKTADAKGWAARAIGSAGLLVDGEWVTRARPEQYPAGGAPATWLVIGGRGSGKTRLGAEWVNALARGLPPFALRRHGVIALIGETIADVREVMIEGPAGIVTTSRADRPRYEATRRRLVWESGMVAQVFSAEEPDSLRGPQFEAAWLDEFAKWRQAEACFDMLQFGLRLGEKPMQLITTTPRPLPLLKRLIADPAVKVTRMRTQDNAENLAAGFLDTIRRRYGGTRLGRQELDGEMIGDRDGALWTRALLERAAGLPEAPLGRIVVAIDPPASSSKASDACGIVAAGLDAAGRAVVLADATARGLKPAEWAARAIALWRRLEADCIVAEVNQGGDMVIATLRTIDPAVPARAVRATRGKWLRAEPVAALYEQGRVRHAARFPELEDEMADFGPDGLSSGRSPDRLDALVWAVSELMLTRGAAPRVRGF